MALAPSSPRLPSPPPAAEIQITPNSPSGGPAATLETTQMEQSLLDANSKRRIHPGTKCADMAAGPPLVPLSELESAFSLQEHLAALHYNHTEQGTRALTRATANQIAHPPAGIDRTLWLYELCRFLISQCNTLIVGFLFDSPPCSASTCPEMRASEWQFLCAVHEQPKSCCAIDYCCHTLDWAANVVSDQNIFPSRFVILNDTQSKNVGLKNLVNVFRRLHRIFAHAWFQHRSVFWAVEGQSGLYVFFKTVCDLYDLLPAENYKLPPEAEGLDAPETEPETPVKSPIVPTILKAKSAPEQSAGDAADDDDNLQPHGRTTTRRHIRSSPSTGSAVTTVLETEEEEADAVARGFNRMHLVGNSPNLSQFADEPEITEVPVIVNPPARPVTITKLAETDKAHEVEAPKADEESTSNTEAESAVDANSAKTTEHTTEGTSTSSAALAAADAPLLASASPAEPSPDSSTTKSMDQDGSAVAIANASSSSERGVEASKSGASESLDQTKPASTATKEGDEEEEPVSSLPEGTLTEEAA